jgi:uncharacterized coiled-coil protein SlyX
LEAHPIQLG